MKLPLFVFSFIILALVLSLFTNVFFIHKAWQDSIVIRVVDGDSMDLADGRRIRLLALDAPEKDRCFADEARTHLVTLVKGKSVRVTDIVTDDYGRQMANVFVGSLQINEQIAAKGAAKFVHTKSPQYERVKAAALQARRLGIGIYSSSCRTTDPTTDCVIKGNLRHGAKFYQLPGCDQYDQIIVDESFGDQWFCTEDEAQTAGFTRASTCR